MGITERAGGQIIRILSLLLATILITVLAGCGGAPIQPLPEAGPAVPERAENSDQARLRGANTGPGLPPGEAAELSDRLLATGNTVTEQDIARLELVLLKALKSPDKTHHATLFRNLGIINYNQKKYQQARQYLQSSRELNPKNSRTHYYLAQTFVHLGDIYLRKGEKKKSSGLFKQASYEMELARKFDPGNPLYRQNVKQLSGRE